MKTTKHKVGFAALAAGLAMLGSAPAHAQGSAYVRVLHTIPSDPKVDVYADSRRIYDDVAFSGDPTKYTRVPAGVHRLSVILNDPRITLYSQRRRLRLDRFYTFAILGTKERQTIRLLDDTSGTTHPRRARLSITHLSIATPPVDVIARSKNLGRYVTLTQGLRYGQTRQFLIVPGPYEIFVRSRGNVIKRVDGVDLQAGRRYAAYALGRVGARKDDNEFRLFLDVASSQ